MRIERMVVVIALLSAPFLLWLVLSPARGTAAQAVVGQELYRQKCGNCHGQEGEGFLRVYPPIRNSRFLGPELHRLPCLMRYGISGELQVGTLTFNQNMPGDPRLSGVEMTRIIDYMLHQWGHPERELLVEDWLADCSGRLTGERTP